MTVGALEAFDRISDGWIALDADWRYTFVSAAAGEILGRNPAELIAKHIWTEFPTSIDNPFRVAYETAMAQGRSLTVESFDDTRNRWFENRIYASDDGLTVLFIDVSARKWAETTEIAKNEILAGIAAHRPLLESLTEIAHLHERLNRDALCSLLLVSPDGNHVLHGSAPSLPEVYNLAIDGLEIGEGQGSCGTAAARRVRVIVSDIATHPYWDDFRDLALAHNLRSCWSTPVLSNLGEVLGTFAVYYREERQPSVQELDSIDAMLSITAIAIESDRLIARLRERDYFFDMSTEIFCIFDMVTQQIVQTNPTFHDVTGYQPADLATRHYLEFVHADDRAMVVSALETLSSPGVQSSDVEYRFLCKNGAYRWLAWESILGPDQLAFAVARDVTARREADAALEHANRHDGLTGLPRRFVLESQVAALLANSESVWVFVLGLDRFHSINESMGHAIGDDVLRQTAERLRTDAGEGSPVARFASDKFVVVTTGLDETTANEYAERLRRTVAEPISTESYRLVLAASVGISHAPDHGDNAEDLLQRAEAAMVSAKMHGRDGTCQFSTQQMRDIEERLHLGRLLRRAVDRGDLELHYQPQHRARDSALTGFEALIRWTDADWGRIAPIRFIPIAETMGLMPEIGQWVLNEACRQARTWMDLGHRNFSIAVNVSAQELRRGGLVERVESTLRRHSLPASAIGIELTESSLMENVDRASDTLTQLASIGTEISLDDFGTGYSSLAYLKHFPISKIKIDQSFVRGVPGNRDDASIIGTIVALAHQLRMTVAAEGVENDAQRRFLVGRGCDELQGYHFGKPAAAETIERFFTDTAR